MFDKSWLSAVCLTVAGAYHNCESHQIKSPIPERAFDVGMELRPAGRIHAALESRV